MAAARKKVIVREISGRLSWGYLSGSGFLEAGRVELMAVDGKAKWLEMKEIKTISYVTDFNLDDAVEPEQLGRRSFAGRPRGDGLWLRIVFVDGDSLEGLSVVDIGFIDGLVKEQGVFLTPPDGRSNAGRVFVPRSAMRSVEVLGYVTAPSRKVKRAFNEGQGGLFGE